MSSDKCAICLDDLTKDTTTTECGHIFHASCIEKWKRIKPTCPTCRFVNSESSPWIESYEVEHDDDDIVQYYFEHTESGPVYVEEVDDYLDASDTESEDC